MEKEFEIYKQAFVRARADFKAAETSAAALIKYYEELETRKFPQVVTELIKQDADLWKIVKKIDIELEECTSDNFKTQIAHVFKEVFKKMKSKTVQLNVSSATRWGGNYKICIGREGFALRRNIQAIPVRNSDVWMILKNGEQIVQALRDVKESKWADKLAVFLKVVPAETESFDGEVISIALERPILVPLGYSHRSDKLPMLAEKIILRNSYHGVEVSLIDSEGTAAKFSIDEGGTAGEPLLSAKRALLYYQLHSQLPAIVERHQKLAKPILEKAKLSMVNLNDKFSRELLLAGI